MKWLIGVLSVVLLGLASFQVVMRLAALELSRRVRSEQALTQAIEFDDSNPEFFQLRADIFLNDLRVQRYSAAGEDLAQATRLNPHYWRYWVDLARFQERVGDMEAERSYQKALALSPINGLYHWALFNFMLREGRIDEALVELEEAIELDEELWGPGLDMLIRLSVDSARLLEIWPPHRCATLFLIRDLIGRPNPDEARDQLLRELFDRMLEFEPGRMEELNGLVSYWRARQAPDEARGVWARYQRRMGTDSPEFATGQNLVWNGGFEQPQQSGELGWRFGSGEFLKVDQVAGLGHLSSTGLRVRIDGRIRSPSDVLATQYLLAPPGQYVLSCRYRSDDNKSDGKLQLTLLQTNGGPSTVLELEARASAQWSTLQAPVTILTGADLRLQLDSALSRTGTGVTLWLDDVQLTQAAKDQ